jgi:hypothetical protein
VSAPWCRNLFEKFALLIRHRHLWFWLSFFCGSSALALGSRAFVAWLRPGPLTGGTSYGLWAGLLASLCMIAAGALSRHRRLWPRHSVWSRSAWLRAHVWLGLLSVVLVFCHAGPRLGGPLEVALLLAFGAVILSGVVGWVIQAFVPAAMTERFGPGALPGSNAPVEAPYEQIARLCDLLRQRAVESLRMARDNPAVPGSGKEELARLLDEVHDFLRPAFDPRSPLASAERADALFSRLRAERVLEAAAAEVNEAERLCQERRLLEAQARAHRRLHFWLLLHVPLTVVLFFFAAVHAVTAVFW